MLYLNYISIKLEKEKNNFLILTDTRQQKEKHIIKAFDKQGIKHIQTKLDSADYMALRFKDNQFVFDFSTLIETKKDLLEILDEVYNKEDLC